MSKNYAIGITLFLIFCGIFSINTTKAQTPFLEIKAGPIFNFCKNTDYDLDLHLNNIAGNVYFSSAFGFEFFDRQLKLLSNLDYCSKDYHRVRHSDSTLLFESKITYLLFGAKAKYYTKFLPFYFGVGIYGGYAIEKKVVFGDDMEKLKPYTFYYPEYFNKLDYGVSACVGVQFGLGFVHPNLELEYQYGLKNISARDTRKIFNRSLTFLLGVNFEIPDRRFKKY